MTPVPVSPPPPPRGLELQVCGHTHPAFILVPRIRTLVSMLKQQMLEPLSRLPSPLYLELKAKSLCCSLCCPHTVSPVLFYAPHCPSDILVVCLPTCFPFLPSFFLYFSSIYGFVQRNFIHLECSCSSHTWLFLKFSLSFPSSRSFFLATLCPPQQHTIPHLRFLLLLPPPPPSKPLASLQVHLSALPTGCVFQAQD